MEQDTAVPTSFCHNCNVKMDRVILREGQVPPRPGDISVCCECSAVALFDDLLFLRVPNSEETVELARRDDVIVSQATIERIKALSARLQLPVEEQSTDTGLTEGNK